MSREYTYSHEDRKILIRLLHEYNEYIQDANEDDKYADGWYPVSIEEFYMEDFQEILEAEREPLQVIINIENGEMWVEDCPEGVEVIINDYDSDDEAGNEEG